MSPLPSPRVSRWTKGAGVLGIVSLLAVSFTACSGGSSEAPPAESSNGDAVELPEGTPIPITVPQQTGAAPYEFLDNNNELVGSAVDLTNAIGGVLGHEVNNVEATFEDAFIGLESGKYTWIPSADVTAERIEKFDMVLWAQDQIGLQVLADSPDIGTDMMDLCGLNIGLIKSQSSVGTLENQAVECENAGKETLTVSTFADTPQVALALRSGQIDAQIANVSIAKYQEQVDPGSFKSTGPSFDFVFQGLIVPKDSGLAEILADAINQLIGSGEYDEILARYNSQNMAISKSVVNPDPVSGEATQ